MNARAAATDASSGCAAAPTLHAKTTAAAIEVRFIDSKSIGIPLVDRRFFFLFRGPSRTRDGATSNGRRRLLHRRGARFGGRRGRARRSRRGWGRFVGDRSDPTDGGRERGGGGGDGRGHRRRRRRFGGHFGTAVTERH